MLRRDWERKLGRFRKQVTVPFDMRQLRFTIAAADDGSFYRAARALEVEQSTLSRSILRLERVIGAKSFNRSRAGAPVEEQPVRRRRRPLAALGGKAIPISARGMSGASAMSPRRPRAR